MKVKSDIQAVIIVLVEEYIEQRAPVCCKDVDKKEY